MKRLLRQKGDTLIEVIFALVIIGVIIAAAIQGALSANRSTVAARQRTEATFIAQREMELFRAYRSQFDWGDTGSIGTFLGNMTASPVDMVATLVSSPCPDPVPGNPGSQFSLNLSPGPILTVVVAPGAQNGGTPYTRSLRVGLADKRSPVGCPASNSTGTDVISVQSTVSWTSPYGTNETVEINSTVSEAQAN